MRTVNKMSGGFVRFKKKLRRSALIKSLIFGLSCGVLAAAGIMIYQKMTTVPPELWLYLPVGAGVALVLGLAAFLILRPSERAIAKKLDTDLNLGEKVQTMLAFRKEDSDMLTLQREDTDERLLKAPARAVRYKHPWVHAFAPVLACTLLVTAIITPVKAVPPPVEEPEPPFELTTWQETALLELIEEVKASDMEASPKSATVSELETLLAALRITTVESDMKVMVITVISNLNRIVREHNSVGVFSLYMTASEHADISAMAMSMEMLNGLEAGETLADAREHLRVEEVSEPLGAYITALDELLTTVVENEVPEDDGLYKALISFSDALHEIQRQMGSYTRDWAQEQLDNAYKAVTAAVSDAIFVQYTNKNVKDSTIARLMEIFGISEDELPEEEKQQLPSEDAQPDDEDQDEEDKGTEGGIGNQEVLYGSDDTIFDPVKNEYVKYGDVINEYFAAVSEKIIDGQIPDTLEQFISDYFATLYDGSEKESTES